jgi:hypothetical protein
LGIKEVAIYIIRFNYGVEVGRISTYLLQIKAKEITSPVINRSYNLYYLIIFIKLRILIRHPVSTVRFPSDVSDLTTFSSLPHPRPAPACSPDPKLLFASAYLVLRPPPRASASSSSAPGGHPVKTRATREAMMDSHPDWSSAG